jgi:hypothetical protein
LGHISKVAFSKFPGNTSCNTVPVSSSMVYPTSDDHEPVPCSIVIVFVQLGGGGGGGQFGHTTVGGGGGQLGIGGAGGQFG